MPEPTINNKRPSYDLKNIADDVTDALNPRLLYFGEFSKDFSKDAIIPGREGVFPKVQVKIVKSASLVQKDATDFRGSNSDAALTDVIMHRYDATWSATVYERNNGEKMTNFASTAAKELVLELETDFMEILDGNKSVEIVEVSNLDTFGPKDITRKIRHRINPVVDCVVLDPAYYSNLIPTDMVGMPLRTGAFGVNTISEASNAAAAITENDSAVAAGFAATKRGIAVATRLPIVDNALNIQTEIITLTNGMSFLLKKWGDDNTETVYYSLSIMAGFAIHDVEAVKKLKPVS